MNNEHRHARGASILAGVMLMVGCGEEPAGPGRLGGGEYLEDLDSEEPAVGQIPFADLAIFFEFNSTDNDLGVQVFLDAEDWRWIKAIEPHGGKILDIRGGGALRELGITELFFESAEPSPGEVLDLFPAGEYRFTGRTTDGQELVGAATLSHNLPPAPSISPGNGAVVDPNNTVIAWAPIPGLAGFQVIVADEAAGSSITVDLGASATSFPVPSIFLEPGTEYKAEVLAIAANGNKTIAEVTFVTMP